MSEINILEQRYVPIKPKVLAEEQIEVYIPTAGYDKPGAASFDPLSFIVTPEGQVKSRRPVSVRNVVDFKMDPSTGIGIVYFDDGSIEEVQFPIVTEGQFKKIGLITTIELTEQSFVTNYGKTFAAFSTGFSDNKYLAFVESYGSEYYITEEQGETGSSRNGVYTVPDTLFKGEDGSILYEVSDASEIVGFKGRLILLGGDIFTDNNIISISYDSTQKLLKVTKSDLSVESIEIFSRDKLNEYAKLDYVDKLINDKVANAYISRGVVTFDKLPAKADLYKWINSVWIVNGEFTIPDGDPRFVFEQRGKTYPSGTNIVASETGGITFLDIIGSVVGSGNCFEKTEFDYIFSTVDVVKTTDDGIDVQYNYGGYTSTITLPIKGGNGINVDVSENNDFIEIKLDEVYVKPTDYATNTKVGVVRGNLPTGIDVNTNGALQIVKADENLIKTRHTNATMQQHYKPIVPDMVDIAVLEGLTTNHLTLSEDSTDESGNAVEGEKTKACKWLGAVKANTTATTEEKVLARVYGIDNDGNQIVLLCKKGFPFADSIPIRDSDGNIEVSQIPYNYRDATSKWFVENGFVAKNSVIRNGVYGRNAGEDAMYEISLWSTGGTVARRTNKGGIRVVLDETDQNPEEMATPRGWVEDNFVAKITTAGSYYDRVYAVDRTGATQKMFDVSDSYVANTIAQRTESGTVRTNTPTNDMDATNKTYVDDRTLQYENVVYCDLEDVDDSDYTYDEVYFRFCTQSKLTVTDAAALAKALYDNGFTSDDKAAIVHHNEGTEGGYSTIRPILLYSTDGNTFTLVTKGGTNHTVTMSDMYLVSTKRF